MSRIKMTDLLGLGVSRCKIGTAGCYDVLVGVIKNGTGTETGTQTDTTVVIIAVVDS